MPSIRPKPVPVNASRELRAEEMFFSTTDQKGIICSGNEVFRRISGYAVTELLGSPHNIIRHPDMPRAVFRLVWDYLKQGKAVAGYVKNMAADGRHYWVVAMISPLRDGYLSVRFKPTGMTFPVVEQLYAAMRRIERESVARGEPGAKGMDLAAEKLLTALKELGFADYSEFMTTMLHSELKSRDGAIASSGARLVPTQIDASAFPGADRLKAIYRHCTETYQNLNRLYNELDEYARLDTELHSHADSVIDQACDFRIVALNSTIKAALLGEQGRCIGVISSYLSETSSRISEISAQLEKRMIPVAAALQSVIFNLAAARLQLEMLMQFCHEIATAAPEGKANGRDVDDLQTAFARTIVPAIGALQEMEKSLRGFGDHAEEFRKLTITLQVAQIGGAVEASRIKHDDSLAQTFRDVRGKTEATKASIAAMAEVISRFDRLANATPAIVNQISGAIERTKGDVREFLALLTTEPSEIFSPTSAGTPADGQQIAV